MIAQRRGKNVAIAGTFVQLGITAAMLVIWLHTGSLAAFSAMLLSLAGVPLWLMVGFLFYCRQLAGREEAELEDLAKHGATKGTIFETEDGAELRPAASRLAFVERWIVPIFTLLWAGLQVAFAAILLSYPLLRALGKALIDPLDTVLTHEISNPQQGMLLVVVVGFAAFLFSRYAIGMGRDRQWRLLRATGSYLLANVLLMAALLGGLIGASQNSFKIDLVVAYLAPVIQIVLAAELLLNFILDLYRPRVPGQEYRPSFDSRLCNLLAESGRVGHSIAETLNYQFGFEVSRTWFYQLLSKAFVPLLVFAAVVLIGISSIVFVREGEQHVVLHWGRPDRVLNAGMHLKWPWPIDNSKRFNVAKVHEIVLGLGEEDPNRWKELDHKDDDSTKAEVSLWTKEHPHEQREELDFLVAVPPEARKADQEAASVSVIKLVVPVQYVITDVYKYGFTVRDPKELLKAEAHRQMVQYCASATLDSPVPGAGANRPEAIMTYGRGRAARELQKRIQAAVDRLDMGVKITFVGLLAAHPPPEVAEEFEKVLEAERRKDVKRYQAEAEAHKTLVHVAGDPDLALELAMAIRALEELRGLQQLHGEWSELKSRVRDAIRDAHNNISSLEEEILREKLLGRETAKEDLQERYKAYLTLLKEIDAGPETFDYAGNIDAREMEVEELFAKNTGEASVLVARAEAWSWERELSERARYESFRRELMAFQASPKVYSFDRRMDAWDAVLPGSIKYVFGVDPNRVEVRLDWGEEVETMGGVYQEEAEE